MLEQEFGENYKCHCCQRSGSPNITSAQRTHPFVTEYLVSSCFCTNVFLQNCNKFEKVVTMCATLNQRGVFRRLCFQNVLGLSTISFQITSECDNHRPYFQKFQDCGGQLHASLDQVKTCTVFF